MKIDDVGLFAEDAVTGVTAHVFRNEDGGFTITYHKGRFPAFHSQDFAEGGRCIQAMRKIQPDLRKWRKWGEE